MFTQKSGFQIRFGTLKRYICEPGVTEVTVPETVHTIAKEAFRDCGILRRIIIPDTVKSIEPWAFYHCERLEEVCLPEGLQEIPDRAFYNCPFLRKINIPTSVKRIGIRAFYQCESLEELELPKGLTVIAEGAFQGCRSLKTIYLPDSVCLLEGTTFAGCTRLGEVRLSKNLKTLPDLCFLGCRGLKLELHDTLEHVTQNALPNEIIAEVKLHSGKYKFDLYHITPQFSLPVLRLIAEKDIAKKERRFSQLIQQGIPGNLEFTLRLYLAIACQSPIQWDVIRRNPTNTIGWLIDDNAPAEIEVLLEHKILSLKQAEQMLDYAITRKQKRTKIQILLTRYCYDMGGTPHDPVADLKL